MSSSTSYGGVATWNFVCNNPNCKNVSGTYKFTTSTPSASQDGTTCAADGDVEYNYYYAGCGLTNHYNTKSACERVCTQGCTKYKGTVKDYQTSEDVSNYWRLSDPACASYHMTYYHVLIYNRYWHNSTIMPARKSGSATTALLSHMTTAKVESDEDVRHENEATGAIEYYVGPDLETALVGECGSASRANPKCSTGLKNKYSIVGSVDNIEYTVEKAKKIAIGVLYVWIPEVIDFCVDCKGKTGDDLLACSENYCDNLYYYEEGSTIATQLLKEDCIKRCGVKNTPNNCEEKIKDAAFVEEIMANGSGGAVNKKYTYNTKCNKNASGLDGGTDKGYKAYCLMNSPSPTIIDQIHYVNVLCVESTSCDFSDVSKVRVTKGRRIDYNTKAHVVKNCKVWFDNESWKYYYATVPRGDKFGIDVNGNGSIEANSEVFDTRSRMLSIIDNYHNAAAQSGFQGPISQNVTLDGSAVHWEDLDYDIGNFAAKTKITESFIPSGSQSSPKEEEYVLIEKEDTVEEETHNITESTTNDNPPGTYSYERYNRIGRTLKTYSSSSSYDATYELPKMYGIGEDKDASIIEYGNPGCGERELAVHAYFLNLHSQGADFKGMCENKVSLEGTMTSNYYEAEDNCPVTSKTASCTVTATGPYHCAQFIGETTIRLNIHFSNTTEVKIKKYGLNEDSINANGKDTIVTDQGTHIYYGVVELTNGERAICSKYVEVNKCEDNGCVITRDNTYNANGTKRYLITDGAGTYYAKTGKQGSEFEKLGMESGIHTYYVQRENGVGGEEVQEEIIGKVVNGNTCKYCCLKPPVVPNSGCDVDLKKVKENCNKTYSTDEHDFDSEEECVDYYACSCPGPTITTDLGKLTEWCAENGTKTDIGFTSANICVSTCCLDPINCVASDNITYRPVSVEQPFPGSKEKDASKKRIIGRNWVGQETNITDPEIDGNSVYNEVEYEIDLTPEIVREIRKQNEDNVINQSIYYDHEDAKEMTKDEQMDGNTNISSCNTGEEPFSQKYEGYCSKFIHTSNYFSVIRGHVVK